MRVSCGTRESEQWGVVYFLCKWSCIVKMAELGKMVALKSTREQNSIVMRSNILTRGSEWLCIHKSSFGFAMMIQWNLFLFCFNHLMFFTTLPMISIFSWCDACEGPSINTYTVCMQISETKNVNVPIIAYLDEVLKYAFNKECSVYLDMALSASKS